jgi:hypothetical protein
MPCTDGGPSYEQQLDERRVPAALCAILSTLESEVYLSAFLDRIDWTEAGITREWLVGWWAKHKRADAMRRTRDEEHRQRVALQQQAIAKLTPEERRALSGHVI